MNKIKQYWQDKPLQSILIIALLLRLAAAFFAQGYGMHDDHYLVIEASQSWADGTDYNDWLPGSQLEANPSETPKPQGHSFFYAGIHFLLFKGMHAIGIDDPKTKMILIRLLHALFSLIVVALGYKITLRLSNEKNARLAGLLLASLWVMPFLSVRNLVEVVCIPFLFMGIWYLLNSETKKHVLWNFFVAGLITGISFSIRFQSAFFILGIGLSLLLLKKFKGAVFFGMGVIICIAAIQGVVDMIIWHRPFAEMIEYINYNNAHKLEYGTNNFEMYLLIIGVLLVLPPIGIFFFMGFFRTWKKYLILFLPVFLFFAFHEYFPNKQERFILPIFPFYVMLGVIGWNEWVEKSQFWQKRQQFLKGSWIFFWILNISLLLVFTFTYSKKARIEAMYYFHDKGPIKQVLIEDAIPNGRAGMLPGYYSGQWFVMYALGERQVPDSAKYRDIEVNSHYFKELYNKDFFRAHPDQKPEYILFIGKDRIADRVQDMKNLYPKIDLVFVSKPGLVDKILYKLNPVNQNVPIYIYKVN